MICIKCKEETNDLVLHECPDKKVEICPYCHLTKPCECDYADDFRTPEGYDDSPDQGIHQYDGGGTFF